jgi:hypothetical protein
LLLLTQLHYQELGSGELVIHGRTLSDPQIVALLGGDFSAKRFKGGEGIVSLKPPVRFSWEGDTLSVSFHKTVVLHHDGGHAMHAPVKGAGKHKRGRV